MVWKTLSHSDFSSSVQLYSCICAGQSTWLAVAFYREFFTVLKNSFVFKVSFCQETELFKDWVPDFTLKVISPWGRCSLGHSSPIQLQTHVTYLRQIVPSLLKDEVKKNKTKHSIVVFVLGSVQGRIISSILCVCVCICQEKLLIFNPSLGNRGRSTRDSNLRSSDDKPRPAGATRR